jgi:hypothetical protein
MLRIISSLIFLFCLSLFCVLCPMLFEFLEFAPELNSGVRGAQLCVFTFLYPCYDVHYDFHIQTLFVTSLYPFFCRRVLVLFMLCLFTHGGVHHFDILYRYVFKFRGVMSVMCFPHKRCSASVYTQLFVGGFMSYLCCFYLRKVSTILTYYMSLGS